MKPLALLALLVGCSPAAYSRPDLSGLSFNTTGLDDPIVDDGGTIGDLGPAVLVSNKAALPFGTVVTHQSTSLSLILSNTGDPSLLSPVVITGAAAFVIAADACTGQWLATTCTLEIRFAPDSAGAVGATLTVSGSGGGTVSVQLSGTGADAGALEIMPTAAPFGSVLMGMFAETNLTLQNVGVVVSGSISVDVSGPDKSQFHVAANNCAGGLAPSASCTLTLRFVPTATGPFTATLSASDAYGGTVTAPLSGTGM